MSLALDILDRLIAFPTVSRDGNIDLIDYVADTLSRAGIAPRLYPHESGDRASLFATIGPAGDGGVVLSGHTDVVPVDGQAWTVDPFRMTARDGRLYGRGAADMKGFVACAIAAMVTARPERLARPLHLALSYDEEIGCVGVRPMLSDLAAAGLRPDWVLVGEPTRMKVATGHKGKINARATCCGRAAHSALAPTGLNAIYLACDFIGGIRAAQADIERTGVRDELYAVPYTTLGAGVIRGGVALNIVPERCEVDFEIRSADDAEARRLLDRLFVHAGEVAGRARGRFPEAEIAIDILNEYPGLAADDASPAAQAAYALTGDNSPIRVAFGTEGGLFRNRLATPVVVCGPGDMEQGHKPDEYVEIGQIEACGAMLSRLTETLERGTGR